jgi:hypothetical protein
LVCLFVSVLADLEHYAQPQEGRLESLDLLQLEDELELQPEDELELQGEDELELEFGQEDDEDREQHRRNAFALAATPTITTMTTKIANDHITTTSMLAPIDRRLRT